MTKDPNSTESDPGRDVMLAEKCGCGCGGRSRNLMTLTQFTQNLETEHRPVLSSTVVQYQPGHFEVSSSTCPSDVTLMSFPLLVPT